VNFAIGKLPRAIQPSSYTPLSAGVIRDVPFHGGWQIYAKYQSSTRVQSFLGGWVTPDAPTNYTKQTVFLFTGLQNIDWVTVVFYFNSIVICVFNISNCLAGSAR
jgi:hypothetical protein